MVIRILTLWLIKLCRLELVGDLLWIMIYSGVSKNIFLTAAALHFYFFPTVLHSFSASFYVELLLYESSGHMSSSAAWSIPTQNKADDLSNLSKWSHATKDDAFWLLSNRGQRSEEANSAFSPARGAASVGAVTRKWISLYLEHEKKKWWWRVEEGGRRGEGEER